MLNPHDCISFVIEAYESLPPGETARLALDALNDAGYVIVPKNFIGAVAETLAGVK